MKCINVLYNVISTNGCFNEIFSPNWAICLSARKGPLIIVPLSNLNKALLSRLNFIGCTSRGAVFVVHYARTKQTKKPAFLLLLFVNKRNIFLTDLFSF